MIFFDFLLIVHFAVFTLIFFAFVILIVLVFPAFRETFVLLNRGVIFFAAAVSLGEIPQEIIAALNANATIL